MDGQEASTVVTMQRGKIPGGGGGSEAAAPQGGRAKTPGSNQQWSSKSVQPHEQQENTKPKGKPQWEQEPRKRGVGRDPSPPPKRKPEPRVPDMWDRIREKELWVPMSERCNVGTRSGRGHQVLFSKKMNEHHKPSFMGDICRVARATPFTKEDLIGLAVRLAEITNVRVGDLKGNPEAYLDHHNFRRLTVHANVCGGSLQLIDRLWYGFTSNNADNPMPFERYIFMTFTMYFPRFSCENARNSEFNYV